VIFEVDMKQLKLANGEAITDDSLHGWFDYGTALYRRDDFEVGTRESIAFGMAKNEMEGVEYILAANADYHSLHCEISPLVHRNGNTLDGTVYVAQKVYVRKPEDLCGYYPDALLEQDNPYLGGTFDVVAGRS
jgi:hypothetical protein